MSDGALIDACVAALAEAERSRRTIDTLSSTHPTLDEAQAYRIQARRLDLRRDDPAVGFKLGYTSAAMRAQMGIDHPNFGVLTAAMAVDMSNGRVDSAALIHPRVEPEIALRTARSLAGPGLTREDVIGAIDAVLPGIEIVDTRYHEYRFGPVDNIADNSSAARFAVGAAKRLQDVPDLRLIPAELHGDNGLLDQGIGANALGDPLEAVAWLANFLAESQRIVPAGSLILTGGLTRSYEALPGSVFRATFAGLGDVSIVF